MQNVLEFYLKMKDMMSGGLVKVAQTAKQSFAKVNVSLSDVQANTAKAGTGFEKMAEKAKEARAEVDKLKESSSALKGLLMGGLMAIGVGGIMQQSLAQAAMKENQQIAFKVLTGSKSFGAGLYNNIVKMADATPFESQDLARGAKTMLGYGVNKNAIMPDLKMLGEVASAQDNPADALQSLALAFGQVQAKGHLAGQEVLQMINAGFNPLKEISDMTGRSMNDLDKIMEKGGISANMLTQAYVHATGAGGKFHDMMLEQSQTLGGQYSTFMDLIHSKMRGFGELLSPMAKGLMQMAGAILNSKPAMVALGVGLVAATGLLISAAMATGLMARAMDALTLAVTRNPFTFWVGIAATAIGLLLPLVQQLFTKTHTVRDEWDKLIQKEGLLKAVNQGAAASIAEQTAKAKILIATIKDETLSHELRLQKLNELKSAAPGYFNHLTLAKSQTDEATQSLDKYTEALLRNARAQAAQEKITELERVYINTAMANHDAAETSLKTIAGGSATLIGKRLAAGQTGGAGAQSVLNNADRMAAAVKADEAAKNKKLLDEQQDRINMLMGFVKQGDKQTGPGGADGLGDTAKNISAGGPRVININGVTFMNKLADHVNINNQGDLANVEMRFQEMFLRILNSGASVQ